MVGRHAGSSSLESAGRFWHGNDCLVAAVDELGAGFHGLPMSWDIYMENGRLCGSFVRLDRDAGPKKNKKSKKRGHVLGERYRCASPPLRGRRASKRFLETFPAIVIGRDGPAQDWAGRRLGPWRANFRNEDSFGTRRIATASTRAPEGAASGRTSVWRGAGRMTVAEAASYDVRAWPTLGRISTTAKQFEGRSFVAGRLRGARRQLGARRRKT